MPKSYLFYDIETSGLNKCFDQVLRFAAIRVDLDLNEIERHEISVKLSPDIIPAPSAIIVNKLTLEQMQQGRCEYEAIKEIHRLFNTPGTITVGYNNLGFDDEFLRFSFYRNLLTPYTHQYANGCGRMDIYSMVVMYYLFKRDAVFWPKLNGVITLKLEHLSVCNKLMVGSPHDAMSDVEATLKLARLLKKKGAMWEYLCGCFDKKTDLERYEKLTFIDNEYKQALLIDGGFGGVKFYQSPAVDLGFHYHYKNQILWLPMDIFNFSEVNADNIAAVTFVNRKRFGEPPILLPLTNHYCQYLSDERSKLLVASTDWLQKNHSFILEIAEYYREYKYPEIQDLDIDAALYQIKFISDRERPECDAFHAADLQEKISMLDSFTNANLRTQATRVLGRNYLGILVEKKCLYEEFSSYLKEIKSGKAIANYKNERRFTRQAALMEIDNLLQSDNLNVLQTNLLTELSKYIQSW